jgi:hypothetical protein
MGPAPARREGSRHPRSGEMTWPLTPSGQRNRRDEPDSAADDVRRLPDAPARGGRRER